MPGVSTATMADVHQPESIADPYPLYRRIREIDPVLWDERMVPQPAWVVTGYATALEALRDPALSARRTTWDVSRFPEELRDELSCPAAVMTRQLPFTDPPDHTRVKSQLSRPLLPRAVEALRPTAEKAAGELLDAVAGRERFDAMADFAFPLSATILGTLIGVPAEDRERIWRRILSWGILVDDGPLAYDNPAALLRSMRKYVDYFRGLIDGQRREGTLIQILAESRARGLLSDEDELLSSVMFVLTAGQATTSHQIGNALLALLGDPDCLYELRRDPGRVAAAVPELIRYDSSVQLTRRRVAKPVLLGGHRLSPGEDVYVWLGAANRDPARFPDPDRLDLDRESVHHLAFSHGIHYCTGGQLGQLITEVAIRTFVERIEHPRVEHSRVERSGVATFRGPHALPVSVH